MTQHARNFMKSVGGVMGYAGASLAGALFWLAVGVGAAQAQSTPPPATQYSIDANGVDLVTAALHVTSPGISIGQPGQGGLSYAREYDSSIQDWRDNLTGTINATGGSIYTVTLMGASETFTLSGGVYTSTEGRGGTLTFASNIYTYTTSSGAVALYDKALASTQPTQANEGRVTQMTTPSGERLTFTYTELRTPALPAAPTFLAHRLQSVTNNFGYQLAFEYQTSTADATGLNLVKATAINNAIESCAPSANGCSLINTWPSLSFGIEGTLAAPTARTVTNALNQTTRYALSSGRVTGIRLPSSASDDVTIGYTGSTSKVQSVASAAGTWTYSFSWDTTTYATVVDPLQNSRMFTSNPTTNRILTYYNGVFMEAQYAYDTQGRLTRITQLDGSYTNFTYDARGNLTETRQVGDTGSGVADIVTTASYPTSCVNPVTCNLPTSTTDARGFRTDYTYDSSHGGLLTVTAPAPSGAAPVGSGTRPQTRYTYQQTTAWVRVGDGHVQQTPVWRLAQTSQCQTAATCDGGVDEVEAALTYRTGSIAAPSNAELMSATTRAGDNSLAATTSITYDTIGNVLTVDGPLAGTADTARVRYDALRRRIGVIGPDPDGAGALKHRATRFTYANQGWATSIERGTVDSQADADWSAFANLETLNLTYDAAGRRIRESYVASGATQAVTQYSYDAASRLDCVAVRMNQAVFGALPNSACTLSTEGANGPDRISRTTYDAANRPLTTISGLGTSAQQTSAAQTYGALSNAIGTLADANGNLTTYEYDGHDRLYRIRFPNASGGGSSTTDYEQYTYDANGNVTQDRRRDGAAISFAYDNLSRATTMTPSAGAAVTYAYDLFSRPTSIAYAGTHTLTFAYDPLSRNTSVTRVANGATQTVSYQYDLAGRRTRVTWPDGFYAQYDVDLTGAVTAIRENGAASGVGVLASYAYDNYGRRTSVARGNGTATTYAYDAASLLVSLTQDLASSASDQSLSFSYNRSGQALTRTGSNAAYVWPQPSPSTTNATANGLNQLATLNGAGVSHDGRGNLTAAGAAAYGYDIYNRLTSAGAATLGYDPAGRLYETAGGGVTTRFLYDGVDAIAEYNASGALLRRYVHGPGVDEPIVWYEGSGTTDRRWLHADRLGSVIAVSDASGAALSINAYDEYGAPGSSNAGRFQYTGQMWLPEAGLYHYKARAYAPSLGRFLQSDPILHAGGMNLYAYVGGDPVNASDPMGTCQLWRKDYWNVYSDGHREWVRSETYTVGCDTASGPPTPRGNGEEGGDGSGEEEDEDEEAIERYCSGLAQAVANTRAALGSYSGGWRWNSMEALIYDRWAAAHAVRGHTGASFLFGGVSAGAFLLSRQVPHPALDVISGATGILSLGYSGMAGFRQSELDALNARIDQLEAQAAGIC
ncbi:MAG: RHS repeat-associated core domain-containing protein [Hyphomonadaceae bacterium]|nr:RHS repeat-associated core domain-containing protein [Hyphomonadaceae bacterium]